MQSAKPIFSCLGQFLFEYSNGFLWFIDTFLCNSDICTCKHFCWIVNIEWGNLNLESYECDYGTMWMILVIIIWTCRKILLRFYEKKLLNLQMAPKNRSFSGSSINCDAFEEGGGLETCIEWSFVSRKPGEGQKFRFYGLVYKIRRVWMENLKKSIQILLQSTEKSPKITVLWLGLQIASFLRGNFKKTRWNSATNEKKIPKPKFCSFLNLWTTPSHQIPLKSPQTHLIN